MRPLILIVGTADGERLRAALTLAAAQAALGGAVTLFLQLDAVSLLRPPIGAPEDARHRAKILQQKTLVALAAAPDGLHTIIQ